MGEDLDKIVQLCIEIQYFISASLQKCEFDEGVKSTLLLTFLSSAIEHHEATCLLTRAKRYDTSAHALQRTMTETICRGVWVARIATEPQLMIIWAGDDRPFPQLKRLKGQIDKVMGNDLFSTTVLEDVDSLNSFTHNGHRQLLKHFNENGDVCPDYSNEDRVRLVKRNIVRLVMGTLPMIDGLGLPEVSARIADEYAIRFPPATE